VPRSTSGTLLRLGNILATTRRTSSTCARTTILPTRRRCGFAASKSPTPSSSRKSTLTSRFVFDDALDDEIIATQPIYKDRGARDTTNKTDDVVPTDKRDAYAYKTIAIPNSMCSLGGPGGPGFGHPPHGDRPPFYFLKDRTTKAAHPTPAKFANSQMPSWFLVFRLTPLSRSKRLI
jgi:hypothetical protein